MNNVIKILIYLLVALLLVSWLITVGKSCTDPGRDLVTPAPNTVDRTDSANNLMEELEGDTADFSQELESILDEEEAKAQEEPLEEIDYSSYDPDTDVVQEEPDPEPRKEVRNATNSKPRLTSQSSSGSGNYLVIAGSYIQPDNANRQRDKLSKLGYNAEVVSFELSEYHTVLAGRFDDYSRAKSVVDQLSGDKVNAYVKKRSR
ncbi:MAG: SPOR domain-containing protein [Saprospiraceae bacterium]|nr:SPOR domain-containing protein [Saprospiraceae bacterium]